MIEIDKEFDAFLKALQETEIIPLNCRLDFKVLQSNNEV